MDLSSLFKALPIAAAIALAPLVLQLLKSLFPPRRRSSFGPVDPLDRHNGWINGVATVLCIGSFVLPFLLFGNLDHVGRPALGLGFGAAAVIPSVWIALATLPFGNERFRTFWHDSVRRYGIGLPGMAIVFGPMFLLGAASVFELMRRGVW
ncbi:hypothetical protein QFZ27_002242 [Inquilinus ginsengisoli]|uniref:hypothetical protein n=1 Tax=Inquilinus ginsengisoli TaxID=363840 RepID=UPI003D1AB176